MTPSIPPPLTPPATATVINATAPTDTVGTKQQPSFKVKGRGRNKIPLFEMEGGGTMVPPSVETDGEEMKQPPLFETEGGERGI